VLAFARHSRVRGDADVRRIAAGCHPPTALEIYLQRETDADAASRLSLLLIVVAAGIVLATAGSVAGPL
jgi:hypothetical protein